MRMHMTPLQLETVVYSKRRNVDAHDPIAAGDMCIQREKGCSWRQLFTAREGMCMHMIPLQLETVVYSKRRNVDAHDPIAAGDMCIQREKGCSWIQLYTAREGMCMHMIPLQLERVVYSERRNVHAHNPTAAGYSLSHCSWRQLFTAREGMCIHMIPLQLDTVVYSERRNVHAHDPTAAGYSCIQREKECACT